MKSVVFVETIQEANFILNHIKVDSTFNENLDIIALNPNIASLFKSNNVKYYSSSRIIDINCNKKIMDKCENIENNILEKFTEKKFDYENYFLFDTFMYYFRQIWRHFLWNIELINKCFVLNKYSKAYGFLYKFQNTKSPWIEDNQLYIGTLLKKYCVKNNIEFKALETENPEISVKNKIILKTIFSKFIGPFYLIFLKIISTLIKNKKILLISNTSYNLDQVCYNIKKNHNDILIFAISGKNNFFSYFKLFYKLIFSKYLKNNESILKNNIVDLYFNLNFANSKKIIKFNILKNITLKNILDKNYFEFCEINFQTNINKKICNDLLIYFEDLENKSFNIKKLIKILRPNLILSQMNLGLFAALGYYGNQFGIKSILISHGSHINHNNCKYSKREHQILARNLLHNNYNILAIQSPLAKEYLDNNYNDKNVQIISIKPLIWGNIEKLDNKNSDNTFKIIHASSLKYRHQKRYIYETGDEYVSALIDIINVLKNYRNLELIIKTRPQEYEMTIKSLINLLGDLPTNVSIETNEKFIDVLKNSNLLISFSSTTIEESLSNKIPVLMYGGNGRYSHIPIEEFNKLNNSINVITFIKNHKNLDLYFEKISKNTAILNIENKLFNKYSFDDSNSISFYKWFNENI